MFNLTEVLQAAPEGIGWIVGGLGAVATAASPLLVQSQGRLKESRTAFLNEFVPALDNLDHARRYREAPGGIARSGAALDRLHRMRFKLRTALGHRWYGRYLEALKALGVAMVHVDRTRATPLTLEHQQWYAEEIRQSKRLRVIESVLTDKAHGAVFTLDSIRRPWQHWRAWRNT